MDKYVSALVIGDPHFQTSNVLLSEKMSNAIIQKAKELLPDFIVCLGDILHEHKIIHVVPLTHAINFLKSLSEISRLYVIIGNHDRPNNSDFLSSLHPFSSLKYWTNTVIVDHVIVDEIKGLKFVFVPYVPPGRFIEALTLSKIKIETIKAFFAHQEFKNANINSILSLKGDEWPLDYPLVISGHIHQYQRPQPNIIYTGTPVQHTYAAIDTDDKAISIFRFTFDNSVEERIGLGLPRKLLFILTPNEIEHFVPPEKEYVKIIITATPAEIKALTKNRKIKRWISEGIKIDYKPITTNKDPPSSFNLTRYSTRLYIEVVKDPDQLSAFQRLFGKAELS